MDANVCWHPFVQSFYEFNTLSTVLNIPVIMLGKIRQKLLASQSQILDTPLEVICPICERPIPDSQKDLHHLIPKSKGGKATEYLHRICHRQIHALFTETELAKRLNTAQALKEQAAMQKFIEWVKSKPDDFYERSAKSQRIKR